MTRLLVIAGVVTLIIAIGVALLAQRWYRSYQRNNAVARYEVITKTMDNKVFYGYQRVTRQPNGAVIGRDDTQYPDSLCVSLNDPMFQVELAVVKARANDIVDNLNLNTGDIIL